MAYEKELDFVEADYFMKQFRRHRNYSKQIDMSLDDYFNELTIVESSTIAPADNVLDNDIDRDVVVPPTVEDQSEDDGIYDETVTLLADAMATIAMLESVNASIVLQC
jgi:hypothetical protein